MKRKQFVALMAATVMTVGLLAGCGDENGAGDGVQTEVSDTSGTESETEQPAESLPPLY